MAPQGTPGCSALRQSHGSLGLHAGAAAKLCFKKTDSSAYCFNERKKKKLACPPVLASNKVRNATARLRSSRWTLHTPSTEQGSGGPPAARGDSRPQHGGGPYLALLEEGWVLVTSLCFGLGGGLMPWKSSSRCVTHPPREGSGSHGADRSQ